MASTFLEANAGLQYVFGDVSGALRSRLRYTQRQIDGLGTAKARKRERGGDWIRGACLPVFPRDSSPAEMPSRHAQVEHPCASAARSRRPTHLRSFTCVDRRPRDWELSCLHLPTVTP